MTRVKTKPAVHKPVFDADAILRFAALEPPLADHQLKSADGGPERKSLSLLLKAEVVSRLEAEAARKEKTIAQIVEKLVTKHLGKH